MNTAAQHVDADQPVTSGAPGPAVEAFLADMIERRALPTNLAAAIRYALLGGGKRLRPILVVRCCEAVGGTMGQALPPAAAIELIHTFSLVHDDLPAMDDDDLRRGRATLHKYTSEAMAILAGDAMTSLAFELLAACGLASSQLCLELARATTDMIAGQVYDTLPDFDPSTPAMQKLRTIHKHKTGALIRCACRMGAIAGGASDAQLVSVTEFADAIGLMFQVVDDLLDVTATTEQLGKAAGKDAGKGKLTYPGLLGIDESRRHILRLQADAHGALQRLGSAGASGEGVDALKQLCDYMAVRSR